MHELFRPMHRNARSRNGLLSRLGAAVARPWQTNYVCPSIMTVTAVAYALRGYEPYWDAVRPPDAEGRRPSGVAYRVYSETSDGRYPSGGVELRAVAPRALILAECRIRNALASRGWVSP